MENSLFSELPMDMILKIISVDWKIVYRNGKYNLLLKENYNILRPVFIKKLNIEYEIDDSAFYFGLSFDKEPFAGLLFNFNWEADDEFEITYFNVKREINEQQIRTTIQ